jgi:hypothetical protein
VCSAELDDAWWSDPEKGWGRKYKCVAHCSAALACRSHSPADVLTGAVALRSAVMNELTQEGPDEVGHFKGGCTGACRRCKLEEDIEREVGLDLLGATGWTRRGVDRIRVTLGAQRSRTSCRTACQRPSRTS